MDFPNDFFNIFEIRKFWKKSFGTSLRKIRRSCIPPYDFFGPVGLPVASIMLFHLGLSKNFLDISSTISSWPLEGQPGQKNHWGGTWSSDFSKGFSKGNCSKCSKFENFEKFPLENPLEKSDDHVPPLWFFWPGWPSSGQPYKAWWPDEDHWKANRANKFIGGVHDRRICLRDFPKEIFQIFRSSKFLKFPLEN